MRCVVVAPLRLVANVETEGNRKDALPVYRARLSLLREAVPQTLCWQLALTDYPTHLSVSLTSDSNTTYSTCRLAFICLYVAS